MDVRHPWQSGPTELISHAIEHLHRPSEFDQRIAYLLFDVGVETVCKTFLQLPEEVSETELPFGKRNTAASGSFHDVISGVWDAAGPKLDGVDRSHVQFYHHVRNRLYHQGNGITIPADKAKGYAELAVELLRRLLAVDLTPELVRHDQESAHRRTETALRESVARELAGLDHELRMAMECVEPELVLPSFEEKHAQWKAFTAMQLRTPESASDRQRLERETAEVLEMDDAAHQSGLEVFTLKPEAITGTPGFKHLMPAAIRRLARSRRIGSNVLFKLALAPTTAGALLILADIVYKLSTDPSDASYYIAQMFACGSYPPSYDDWCPGCVIHEGGVLLACIKSMRVELARRGKSTEC